MKALKFLLQHVGYYLGGFVVLALVLAIIVLIVYGIGQLCDAVIGFELAIKIIITVAVLLLAWVILYLPWLVGKEMLSNIRGKRRDW